MNASSAHHWSFENELDTKYDDTDDSDGHKFDRDIFTEERDMMSIFFIYKWEQLLKWYPYEFHATSWIISKDIMIIIETFVPYCYQNGRLSRCPNASNPIQLNLRRQYHDVVKTSDKYRRETRNREIRFLRIIFLGLSAWYQIYQGRLRTRYQSHVLKSWICIIDKSKCSLDSVERISHITARTSYMTLR